MNSELEENFKEICPPELVLKNGEYASNLRAPFLDLDINVKQREFESELYDKKMYILSLLLGPHIEIAICLLEFFMQQLGKCIHKDPKSHN